MPTIKSWLEAAKSQLDKSGIETSRLDSELILSDVLKVSRTFIHAHPDNLITKNQSKQLEKKLKLRSKSYPMAYIMGFKEFYGRHFKVNKYVLIPKPETEIFIEYIKKIYSGGKMSLVDVGTGSGCIGITAKLEIPDLDVTLLDISSRALKIAKTNANYLGAKVKTSQSDLLKSINFTPDIIAANLPYVDKSWKISNDTKFEPKLALFAKNNGLRLIEKLVMASKSRFLILESDTRQQDYVLNLAQKNGYRLVEKSNYVLLLESDSDIRTK